MPAYPYRCECCGITAEVIKPMFLASEEERCSKCNTILTRMWTLPHVSVPNNSGYFNHGLGKYIHHKSDVRSELAKINDTTGMDLVEIGNERPKVSTPTHSYELPRGALDGYGD